MDVDPDAKNRFNIAVAKFRNEEYEQSQEAFMALTQDYPKFSGPFFNLGMVYLKLDKEELAFEQFNKAIEANNLNLDAYNQLAILSRKKRPVHRG